MFHFFFTFELQGPVFVFRWNVLMGRSSHLSVPSHNICDWPNWGVPSKPNWAPFWGEGCWLFSENLRTFSDALFGVPNESLTSESRIFHVFVDFMCVLLCFIYNVCFCSFEAFRNISKDISSSNQLTSKSWWAIPPWYPKPLTSTSENEAIGCFQK